MSLKGGDCLWVCELCGWQLILTLWNCFSSLISLTQIDSKDDFVGFKIKLRNEITVGVSMTYPISNPPRETTDSNEKALLDRHDIPTSNWFCQLSIPVKSVVTGNPFTFLSITGGFTRKSATIGRLTPPPR